MKNHKSIGIGILFTGLCLLLFDVNIINEEYLMKIKNLWPLILIPVATIIYIKNKSYLLQVLCLLC